MNIVEAMGGVVMLNLYAVLILISCLCTTWAALKYVFTKKNSKARQEKARQEEGLNILDDRMEKAIENLKIEIDLIDHPK